MKVNRYTGPMKLRNQGQRKKQIVAQEPLVLSKAVKDELVRFKESHPVRRFSRNLRTMLIEFLMYEGAIEASYLQDLLYDLQGLFDLLEVIQLENEAEGNSNI